jgi:hypothetical protein
MEKAMKMDLSHLNAKANELAEAIGCFNASNFTKLSCQQYKFVKDVLDKALDNAYEIMDAHDAIEDQENDGEDSRFLEGQE